MRANMVTGIQRNRPVDRVCGPGSPGGVQTDVRRKRDRSIRDSIPATRMWKTRESPGQRMFFATIEQRRSDCDSFTSRPVRQQKPQIGDPFGRITALAVGVVDPLLVWAHVARHSRAA